MALIAAVAGSLASASLRAETTAAPLADVTGAAREPASGDVAASRNAARSRLRECGHQWSSMKKTGTASGMTWKEFSRGCLAKQ